MKPTGKAVSLSEKDCVLLFANEVAGEEGKKIIECLADGATDDKIEKATKYKIADIRAKLNVLHHYGIVEYSREKNMQTGWFTYTWSVNSERALQNLLRKKQKEYEALKNQLDNGENTMLYNCPKNCGEELSVEQAMEREFRCATCNSKLKFVKANNGKELEQKIQVIETLMKTNAGFRRF